MRGRPSVRVHYQPAIIHPGTRVRIDVELDSRSETPVDAINLTLRGDEIVSAGDGQARTQWKQTHASLCAVFPKVLLTKGKHRRSAIFDIPTNAPPTYRGRYVSIDYALEVHVDIPWWPDLHKRFEIPVQPPPRAVTPAGPMVICTSLTGPERCAGPMVICTSLWPGERCADHHGPCTW